jgi:hypothetical protein
MTEQEWLICTAPYQMLDFLGRQLSERKLRLFAVACCRRISVHLEDRRSRRIVEISERFADGTATSKQLQSAFVKAAHAQEAIHYQGGNQPAAEAVLGLRPELLIGQVIKGATETAGDVVADANWERIYRTPGKDHRTQEAEDREAFEAGQAAEAAVQAILLRDIAGNPFKRSAVDPHWLAWNDSTVVKIARAIYEKRAIDRMPILADALEDAGCGDADILRHCREPGEHVRGCWVVDLLLGKA